MNNKKRLNVDLDINIHCEVKKRASIKNMTITNWVVQAILEQIKKEQRLGFE